MMAANAGSGSGPPDHRRADHGAYIAAVCRSMESRGIRVERIAVTGSPGGLREATLELRPDQDAFAEPIPAHASARWHEGNGWLLLVDREALPGHQVREGTSVLPDPEQLAAWAVVTLSHPELSPGSEGMPFRHHAAPDPDFEARLARYQTGTRT